MTVKDSAAMVEKGEYIIGIAVILAALLVSTTIYISMNGLQETMAKLKLTVPAQTAAPAAAAPAAAAPAAAAPAAAAPAATGVQSIGKIAGNFQETKETVCMNGSKPIVYMFTTSWCPHCTWEKPVMKKAVELFGDNVDLRIYDVDVAQPPAADMAVYQKFNPDGSIPTIVIGCKYFQIGSGETLGEAGEIAVIKKAICASFGTNAPAVCAS